MKTLIAFCAVWTVVLCASCATVETQLRVDPEMDFSPWRVYAWYSNEVPATGHPRADSPLFHERVVRAIDRTLAARGFEKVEGDGTEPDFFVQYHLSTERRLEVVEMDRGYGRGPYGRRWGGAGWAGSGWSETYGFDYEVGTLVIDLVDGARRKLVWRGSGTRRISEQVDPDEMEERVNAAVDEILEPFPPSASD